MSRSTKGDRSAAELAQLVGELPALCTIEETAKWLRISRRTLAKLLAAKRIKTVRYTTGGSARVLIPRTAIAEFIAANLD